MKALLVLVLFSVSLPGFVWSQHFDVLIQNARIVDGTGNPWLRGDVGIRRGRIAGIGNLQRATADTVIDARDRILAPGFIDVHTHVESKVFGSFGIEESPSAENFVFDGVTTIVTGNCGASEIDLETWFAHLEERGLGLNLASLIGHNSIRKQVLGEENRAANTQELQQMEQLVSRAMQAGAVGFSTGLLYVPGTYATTEEVIALARQAARYDGIYSSHIRNQAERLAESISEAVTVGREAGIRVQISHLKVKGEKRWGSIDRYLDLIESFRADGIDVVPDAYPYDRASTNLSVTLPSWALAGGREKVQQRLQDLETRRKIVSEMREMLAEMGYADYSYATVALYSPKAEWEGKTISGINLLQGREKTVLNEIETILEMIEQGGAQMVYHFMSMRDVETIYRFPWTAVASDGGVPRKGVGTPHPRSYGTNARVLAEFVREKKWLTLEDAIRRMTSLPARTFNFRDRGFIRSGMVADLVMFDPARVQDHATYEEPHQYSSGFDYVLIAGEAVVSDGRLTGASPGQVLRSNHADSQ